MSTNPRCIEGLHLNGAKSCDLPRCDRPRLRLSRWCREHDGPARRYGHPLAPHFRPSSWAKEQKEVESLFALNANHPGLLQVNRLIADWMARAAADESSYKGAQEIARLVRNGITAQQIITAVAAHCVWEWARPNVFPDDKARDFALSRAVFMLAPRERRVSGPGRGTAGHWGLSPHDPKHSYSPLTRPSALAYVGRHLRQVLSAFLANVVHGVEQARAVKKDRHAMHRLPFAVTA